MSRDEGMNVTRSVLSKMASDERLSASLWRANLMTHMAGQLFIRDIEVPKTKLALAVDTPATFLQLPFDEAIQHFLARGIMTAEEFYALSDAERFRSFTMAQAVSESSIINAQYLLGTAFEPEGVGLDQFISDMQDDAVSLGFTPNSQHYLENVYRTATATSYNAGRLRQQTDPDVVAAGGLWEYMTAEDSRVRSSHAALHGMQFEINDPAALRIYPPNGYQCFPAGTVIEGAIVAGLRAWYSGQLVKITTQSGRVLSVTPNHPLATPSGFVPAGSVDVGQDLLAYNGNVDVAVVGSVNVQDGPARIEDAFGSLAIGHGPSVRFRPVANDLHGDARFVDGDVHVVAVEGTLLNNMNASGNEGRGDAVLSAPTPGLSEEVGHGRLALRDVRLGSATGSLPRATALPDDSGPILLDRGPLEPLCFGASSALDAPLSEPAGNNATVDAKFTSELLLRHAGLIAADKIINVEFNPFHGYVYDLQSINGWIVANGIVTSNCRCAMLTIDREDANPTMMVGSVPDDAIDTGFSGPPDETIQREASA